MRGCTAVRAVAGALTAVTTAAFSTLAAAPAAAANPPTHTPGSLVYVKNGNVWVSTPDGATQRQITADGGVPTGDGTGDSPYRAPSESDGGLIVAVRNQEFNKGQSSEYTQGYLWEMDLRGNVLRKFKPPQFDYIAGGSCSPAVQELPLGLVNAVISPDGRYIAYTAQTYVQTAACDVAQGYSSWIVNVDGSNPHMIRDSRNDTASLEVGQFTADSSKLLVDRADFGSIEDFYVSVPGSTATDWTAPANDDFLNEAYGQPDVRGGILATEGYSQLTSRNALRVWTTSGFTTDPGNYCDYASPVSDAGLTDLELITRPSLSPDGSYVAWEDSSSDGSVTKTGQGIYTLATSTLSHSCATYSELLIPGGEDPFWANAGIYPPPEIAFTSTPGKIVSTTSATFSFAGNDVAHRPISYTCALDDAPATTCTSPVTYSGLADGTHTLIASATAGGQTNSTSTSWQVDTSTPVASLTAPQAAALAASATRVAWRGSDSGSGVAGYDVRYRRAAYSGNFGAWSYPAAWQGLSGTSLTARQLGAGETYCWSVRAVDQAGNAGAWSPARCTAIALDDRALSASRGWHRATGKGNYRATVTTTTLKGAKLTRTHASLDRVGVVATTCPTCGKVGISVGSTRIGTVNLHASGTHHKVITLLPAFGQRSGTVSVTVLTARGSVAIDGLVISRS